MTSVCDPKVYSKGAAICVIAGPRSHTIEAWVVRVAKAAKQPVDWHFVGGRAVVRHLGPAAPVRTTIEQLWPELVAAYLTCTNNFTNHPEARDVQIMWV